MKKMPKLFTSITLASVMLLSACYPEGPEFVEDYDAVYTFKTEPNFNFADPSRQTYYLADTVIVLTDPGASETSLEINPQLLLNRVRFNMNQAGYTAITDINEAPKADYLVLVSVNRSDNYFFTWWGGGWGGWGGWGWGGCCFFPPTGTSQNIRTGSIIVELLDVRRLDAQAEVIPEVWLGTGAGLFRGSNQNLTNRTLGAIDQMFIQSPYLNR